MPAVRKRGSVGNPFPYSYLIKLSDQLEITNEFKFKSCQKVTRLQESLYIYLYLYLNGEDCDLQIIMNISIVQFTHCPFHFPFCMCISISRLSLTSGFIVFHG